MPLLKSKAPQPYIPPKPEELSAEYRSRKERLATLHAEFGRLRAEAEQVRSELADMPAPTMKPAVAALLGDEVIDRRAELSRKLADLQRSITDHETAITLQRARVDDERGRASRLVRDAVKAEYGKRVADLLTRLQSAMDARRTLNDLINQLERDDVSWTPLGVFRANFLGDDNDGQVAQMVREARELGYVD